MDDPDDKISRLPVNFKEQPKGVSLEVIDNRYDRKGCDHRNIPGTLNPVTYYIRTGETEVECSHCGTRLDPMFVILRLARKEMQWHETRQHYIEEMKRLADRKSTKCNNCGKMTRISRRKSRG